jgi:hypothetical protein
MLYQRSLEIERRLETVLSLIRSGDYSTPMIARQLHVSIPTASRYVTALRERGHNIDAQRRNGSWRYVINVAPAFEKATPAESRRRQRRERGGTV